MFAQNDYHDTQCPGYISYLLLSQIDPATVTIYEDDSSQQVLTKLATRIQLITTVHQIIELEKNFKYNTSKVQPEVENLNIRPENWDGAKQEVKEIFKNVGDQKYLDKMLDSITDKLSNVDTSQGNLMQSMMNVAQNVAAEMKGHNMSTEELKRMYTTINKEFQEMGSGQTDPNAKRVYNEMDDIFKQNENLQTIMRTMLTKGN